MRSHLTDFVSNWDNSSLTPCMNFDGSNTYDFVVELRSGRFATDT